MSDPQSSPAMTTPVARVAKTKKATVVKRVNSKKPARRRAGPLGFPKYPISKCIRVPQAIVEQNAGNECRDREAAQFAGVGYTGELKVEISSALKYGLLERPTPGMVKPTDLTRRIVRPQKPNDKIEAMREAILNAPLISDVYKNYRGENLPDVTFLANTVRDKFHVPPENVETFVSVFVEALTDARLLEDVAGKKRVLDITHTPAEIQGGSPAAAEEHLRRVSKGVTVQPTDTCFVMMPFAAPIGDYYSSVYEPAMKKAGIKAIRPTPKSLGPARLLTKSGLALTTRAYCLQNLRAEILMSCTNSDWLTP